MAQSEHSTASDKTQRKIERDIALETSLLLAKLCGDYGLEFNDAISRVEAALTRAYWGELPDGYKGAIVVGKH